MHYFIIESANFLFLKKHWTRSLDWYL